MTPRQFATPHTEFLTALRSPSLYSLEPHLKQHERMVETARQWPTVDP
eukprot:CAMPEP_0114641930 /NCGR_PEP_ID=MMETSP0191-20121206/2538_1 /TAXON_ID=126664 /ORGANISM="Sorites sp." /LENGTH=47 /DNA_ID= /DNA_START= /DNA_END= /DNA_ORIENTATION=